MKILVELCKSDSDQMWAKCEPGSEQYLLLTNACVESKPIGDAPVPIVHVVCDEVQIGDLSRIAVGIPGAAKAIKDALERVKNSARG